MTTAQPRPPDRELAVRVVPLGDRAVVAELGAEGPDGAFRPAAVDQETSRAVHALVARIDVAADSRIVDVVPAYRSVLVEYDPDRISPEEVRLLIGDRIASGASDRRSRLVTIPVQYGGAEGSDLGDVAAMTGLLPDEVATLHTSGTYTVSFVGFSPGFGYLAGLPERLHLPRLATPRARVPAGSVAIGGAQTAVYPSATPGGWRLIGRTPVPMFDPVRGEPALLRPGDQVRFRAINMDEVDALTTAVAKGRYQPEIDGVTGPPRSEPVGRSGRLSAHAVPGFEVMEGGSQTTVQDRGRPGYGRQGIAPNGVLDRAAAAWANRIVGNDADAAVLEMVLAGPTLRATRRLTVSLAGTVPVATVNGRLVRMMEAVHLRPGDVLTCGPLRDGVRGYLAVAGGIATPVVFGSRSTDLAGRFGGIDGQVLRAGEVLPIEVVRRSSPRIAIGPAIPPLPDRGDVIVRVVAGPHLDRLDAAARHRLFDTAFVVSSQSDRMGLRLRGNPITVAGAGDLVSEGVTTGVVQVPGDGQPIILLAARQSVGGYPKPACVIDADLDLLGRLGPGTVVRLRLVAAENAARLGRAFRQRLALLSPEQSAALAHATDDRPAPARHHANRPSAPICVHSPAVGRFRLGAGFINPDGGVIGVALSAGAALGVIDMTVAQEPVVLPRAGRLTRLLVADGAGVEYGQPLAEWLPDLMRSDGM